MASHGDGDLSKLPSVERVRVALGEGLPGGSHAHEILVAAARRAIDAARDVVRGGGAAPGFDAVVADARSYLDEHERSLLGPVINATGVLLHTNLGRAVLGARQLDAVSRIAGSYSNLEYDVAGGRRGSRHVHAQRLLRALTGAEASVVVNNNAAAVLVTLAALCAGREVIVSRGELIEIGGDFRIPDIMAASGARLVEVGTTNRTHLADYEKAIGPDTGAILKIHPSNYKVVGFTASVAARDLAKLARGRKICFVHDIGSGKVSDMSDTLSETVWADEPTVTGSLGAGGSAGGRAGGSTRGSGGGSGGGADIVTFSGDKLLGGPQAGIIVGRAELVDKIARHPLIRALRVDKMTLAALEETLRMHLEGDAGAIPLWAMTTASDEEVEARAAAVVRALGTPGAVPSGKGQAVAPLSDEVKIEVVPHRGVAGGGSAPGAEIGSWAIAITHGTRSAAEIERSLRAGSPPVIARVEGDRVLLDMRTVLPGQTADLARRLRESL